jgi:tRNA(Ile)-lysidine synthase TilS/MesJ
MKERLSQAQKLEIIQARKRRGDVTKVCTAAGFSHGYTSLVLLGRHRNDRIVNVAFNLFKSRKPNAQILGA